jgi:hypothetical protein
MYKGMRNKSVADSHSNEIKAINSSEDYLNKLIKKGEVEVNLTDCDAQFSIEDSLKALGINYKKFLPPNNRIKKSIIYKIQ